jgi:hypothetical protein
MVTVLVSGMRTPATKESIMTILFIGIALLALVEFAVIWLRLDKVKKAVERLEQIHESSDVSNTVELKGLSVPTFSLADELTPAAAIERLVILEHRDVILDLGNQPDGNQHGVIRDVTIVSPPGTTHVVPSLRGFFLMFGGVIRAPNGEIVALNAKDHHLGYEALEIKAIRVSGQTATLRVSGVLRDKNGDDSWSGTVLASVLFLGT